MPADAALPAVKVQDVTLAAVVTGGKPATAQEAGAVQLPWVSVFLCLLCAWARDACSCTAFPVDDATNTPQATIKNTHAQDTKLAAAYSPSPDIPTW